MCSLWGKRSLSLVLTLERAGLKAGFVLLSVCGIWLHWEDAPLSRAAPSGRKCARSRAAGRRAARAARPGPFF